MRVIDPDGQGTGCPLAVVDSADELGGLCILRGCMPSKTLIYSAEVLHLAQQGQVFGFKDRKPRADLAAMQQRKKEIIAEFADYRSGQLQDGRFSLFRSKAKFLDAHTLELTDGKRLHADYFILATGSQIAMPPVPELDQVTFKTSDDVLELSEIPEEVVVLGGGIVACELAQFLNRVGSKVTLLQRSDRILKDFPQQASLCVRDKFEKEGMIVKTGVSIEE